MFHEGDTSEASPAPASHSTPAAEEESEEPHDKKKKKKKLLGRSKSGRKLQKVESQGAADSPIAHIDDKDRKKKKKKNKDKKKEKEREDPMDEEDLERELVLAKTQIAEYASELEEKAWQCKQAQQREKDVNEEVKELTSHLALLQAKVRYIRTYSNAVVIIIVIDCLIFTIVVVVMVIVLVVVVVAAVMLSSCCRSCCYCRC